MLVVDGSSQLTTSHLFETIEPCFFNSWMTCHRYCGYDEGNDLTQLAERVWNCLFGYNERGEKVGASNSNWYDTFLPDSAPEPRTCVSSIQNFFLLWSRYSAHADRSPLPVKVPRAHEMAVLCKSRKLRPTSTNHRGSSDERRDQYANLIGVCQMEGSDAVHEIYFYTASMCCPAEWT